MRPHLFLMALAGLVLVWLKATHLRDPGLTLVHAVLATVDLQLRWVHLRVVEGRETERQRQRQPAVHRRRLQLHLQAVEKEQDLLVLLEYPQKSATKAASGKKSWH